jgi:hypothetical protein
MTTGGGIGYHFVEVQISYLETRHRGAMARHDERRDPKGPARPLSSFYRNYRRVPAAGPRTAGNRRNAGSDFRSSTTAAAPATLDEVAAQPPRSPTAQRLRRFETLGRLILRYVRIAVFPLNPYKRVVPKTEMVLVATEKCYSR